VVLLVVMIMVLSFFPGVTKAANEFFYNQAKHVDRSFVRKKPKIQIKHLMTKPNDLREQISSQNH
jgi:hypothetical protein